MSLLLPDIDQLSLAEQVAQMVVVRASGYLFDHQIQYPQWEPTADTLHYWIQDLGVGGVILLGGSAAELGLRSHHLQSWATIPLLVAADIEEGVGQRFAGATWFPPPMALTAIAHCNFPQALALAEHMGQVTAREALAIGINWLLAPVVDVNNNPLNPVINVRAFGEAPEWVIQLTQAFIRGAHRYPVLTTAKHFPGHGDTAIDSHLELPVLPHSLERLQAIELPPFAAAIAAGVDAVMTAHLQIPALDGCYPATLSPALLTGELRQRLGFGGLIVTDALVMGAIADRFGANEAPVLAVVAGADVLLMPADPEGAIAAVCDAVAAGRIAPEQIQQSVERIWRAKQTVLSLAIASQPHTWDQVSPPPLEWERLARTDALTTVETMLRSSLRVHRPALSRLQQVEFTQPLRNLIVLDDALHSEFLGRQAPAIAIPQQRGYTLQVIDRYTPEVVLDNRPTLLQLFLRGNPFRGSAGLTPATQQWLAVLLGSEQVHALVIYGSPYSLDLLPIPEEMPYVFSYGQMPAAQAIALETLFAGVGAEPMTGDWQPFTT